MPNLIPIDVKISFPAAYDKPPKVKLLKPLSAALGIVDRSTFTLRDRVNPRTTRALVVEYQANFKLLFTTVPLQFCPACLIPISTWPAFVPAVVSGQAVGPGPPLGFCPSCGAVFVSNKILQEMSEQGQSKIIKPAGVIIRGKR